MSTRIDDLEKNIADLMTQAGVEEIEATPEKAKEGSQVSWCKVDPIIQEQQTFTF
ncbi:Heat shock factor-binding protein 1 [Collichthys lucidus]|uniref:Heat shock factor-binding protein 1 n=1 Tax=Collichthys lucidus TaxID=240159 RepID=A0A4U5UEN6_COLLU|nr:Heat shock factor-binding protein 1 [Collichthys lucidus]